MESLKNMLSPLAGSTGALQDTLKLVVIGGTMETARRVSVSAWNGFIDSFFLTAHFSQEDYPYDWLMHWLSKQPNWGRSREFEITTRSVSRHGLTDTTSGDLDDEESDDGQLVHGRRKRKVAFMPSVDTTHTIYYRGHWLRITRSKRYPDYGHGGSLKISVVARNNDILKKLVLEAKRDYEKDAEHRVHIFLADTSYGCWRWNGARQKRPMSSIVLQPGVKDMLLADCKDFLCSEEWYAERGIPFRRGYLLHGVPGSGKTSLIHSLAGELGLDIYVVSLSSKGMSDNTLTTLMGHVPSRCILLLEDLDAAFTRSVSRDASSTGAPKESTASTGSSSTQENNDGSTLSLSGLLNSLDGVAAAEGRLLFATTNHIERLDPALSRPGRMDVWVNFTHATKWQAEGIFKCFFPCKPSSSASSSSSTNDKDASQRNLPGSKRKSGHSTLLLSEDEIAVLAKRFAEAIPENELSVASLQGYLLKNKTRPRECVDEVAEWIIQERETREKLKKEKEKAEREAKEKKEAEEKEKKEKEEKEAKEKEDKEAKEKLERKEARKAKKAREAAASSIETSTASTSNEVAVTSSITPATTETSSESSSSESENTTGVDADTEESVTSEEDESDKDGAAAAQPNKKEKWVAVKSATAVADTAPAVTATTPEITPVVVTVPA
ncbi:P-loop containing nucleoside triphosphate hydrolase protein [Dendrothele bispora CBS 962.96]|uniref:P-loop containing nucleoside triphosphate hydrolase protein n=1 Tax=Dendrothele bispora (strain CBS 962.96) TaxID=1314807 RepID=A0A4V4HG73_DENBC|nr:P-loop containing nucleoside triphosphate hydrolase protein [Dendrothele bispora CBS 962.96]